MQKLIMALGILGLGLIASGCGGLEPDIENAAYQVECVPQDQHSVIINPVGIDFERVNPAGIDFDALINPAGIDFEAADTQGVTNCVR